MDRKLDTTVTEAPGKHIAASSLDSLTGLGNRSALSKTIDEYLATNTPITVILLDLDEFRVINDSLGHIYGDRVLQASALSLIHI